MRDITFRRLRLSVIRVDIASRSLVRYPRHRTLPRLAETRLLVASLRPILLNTGPTRRTRTAR